MPKVKHRTTRAERKASLARGPRRKKPQPKRQGSQQAHREMRARAAHSLNLTVKAYLLSLKEPNV
jgi:hypothetical protein